MQTIICKQCNKSFLSKGIKVFCTRECYQDFYQPVVNCLYCNKDFRKKRTEIKKYPNHFCNHSCATTYHNKLNPIRKSTPNICILCNTEFTQQYSKGRGIRQHCYKCKPNTAVVAKKTNKIRLTRKLQLLEYKGNKCEMCGYNTNASALCFHHIDPLSKLFELNSSNLYKKWALILEEADKCQLLCQNCHLEIHNPECNINNLNTVK